MRTTTLPLTGARGAAPPPLNPQVDLLEGQLQTALPHWHRARLNGLAKALLAVIVASSVNLTKVARAYAGRAQVASHYRRLQRLLAGFAPFVSDGALARLLAAWSGVEPPWVLSLDRTDWQPAQVAGRRLAWVNFLVLGIVKEGVAYPLLWTLLPKKGGCSVAQRIPLLERFLILFGPKAVRFIAMDREFGAKAWLEWLQAHKLNFRLRLCAEHRVSNARGEPTPVRRLCAHLAPAQAERWGPRQLWGIEVEVAVLRLPPQACARTQAARRAKGHAHPGDELVVVVGPCDPHEAPDLLADYRLRWGIETLFGALKSRGFDLESTHVVSCPERLERLLGLLALAFAWAHRTGQWVAEHVRPPRFNPRQGRRAKSLFRHGLDYLCHLLAPGAAADPLRQEHFRHLLQLLSCA
jgi:DDE family transposase